MSKSKIDSRYIFLSSAYHHGWPLVITAAILWLLLSGMFKPLLLIFGVISVAVVSFLSIQLGVLAHHGKTMHIRPFRLLKYWSWLFVEILKSNIDVTRRVFHPALPIKPLLKAVPAKQKSELGRVIYANSITLTPGTIAIDVAQDDSSIIVHALHEDGITSLEQGHMGDRVCELENLLDEDSSQ